MFTAPCRPVFAAAVFALGALASAAPGAAQAQAALSFSSHSGSFLDGNTRMIGWQFSVPAAVNVAALGWFDLGQDGLNRAHQVGVWDTATQALLASAWVPAGTAGVLLDQFRWIDLDAPLALQPGVTYRIAGLDIGNGGDAHVWDANIGFGVAVSGFAVNPALTLGPAGTATGGLASGFTYPASTIGDARRALIGPNLSFSAVSPVPEPATWALMLSGVAALLVRRRQTR
jgi:hypothetical protein